MFSRVFRKNSAIEQGGRQTDGRFLLYADLKTNQKVALLAPCSGIVENRGNVNTANVFGL